MGTLRAYAKQAPRHKVEELLFAKWACMAFGSAMTRARQEQSSIMRLIAPGDLYVKELGASFLNVPNGKCCWKCISVNVLT